MITLRLTLLTANSTMLPFNKSSARKRPRPAVLPERLANPSPSPPNALLPVSPLPAALVVLVVAGETDWLPRKPAVPRLPPPESLLGRSLLRARLAADTCLLTCGLELLPPAPPHRPVSPVRLPLVTAGPALRGMPLPPVKLLPQELLLPLGIPPPPRSPRAPADGCRSGSSKTKRLYWWTAILSSFHLY